MATLREDIMDELKKYRVRQEAEIKFNAEKGDYWKANYHQNKLEASQDLALFLSGVLQGHNF